MNRRGFLTTIAGAAASTALQPPTQPAPARAFELDELTVPQLQDGLRAGRWTARRLVDLYLERIVLIDRRGPALNAIIEANIDAVRIAGERDTERAAGRVRGPLHGIPILLKDNIDTADRMRTSAGSLALAESIAARDAFLVERLREAGAVILGKTNLSEWSNIRASRSTSGWSARGGQTRNPFALDRNPCGSSSGSGAAVSANLASVAVGTETDGSIVCPASACGIVGIKPTLGLISRTGIIPIAHSQDTAGPMARTVLDAAILLTAMVGEDTRDRATRRRATRARLDYASFVDPGGLKGRRIGIARNHFGFDARVDRIMEEAVAALKHAGAIVIDPANISTAGLDASELEVLLYELKADLNRYLAGLASSVAVRSLAAAIAFNEEHKDREMPFFGQDLFQQAQRKGSLRSRVYRRALANNLHLTRTLGIDRLVLRHRLDAIMAPTGGPAWLTDLVNGDHFGGGQFINRGDCRLSQRDRAGGLRVRFAGRRVVLRPRVDGTGSHPDRQRLRSGHEGTTEPAVPADRGAHGNRRLIAGQAVVWLARVVPRFHRRPRRMTLL